MIAIGVMLKAAGGLLKAIPWPVYAGLAILAGGLFYGHLRYNAGQVSKQVEFDEYKAQVSADIAKQASANKAKELKDRLAFDAAATLLEKRNAETKANADRTIADLRSNKLRVRDNLKCPASTTKIAGSAEGDNDSSGAYVSRENQEFFLRLGAEADGIANRLTACQSILTAERVK